VVGSEPRKFSSEDLDDLRGLGQRVVDHLESRRADR
jgi:hypothetical protein